jgi:hypothetical protein
MKRNAFILIILLGVQTGVLAQKWVSWVTYNQSKFIYSPGLEMNYLFIDRLGINIGIGAYFQAPKEDQIINKKHNSNFSYYDANIGLCSNIIHFDHSSIGAILGFKVYYGPEFKKLHYYKPGGYYIYFDQSFYRPEFGVDLGLTFSMKKISFLTKFDFARYRIKIGIGYVIGR